MSLIKSNNQLDQRMSEQIVFGSVSSTICLCACFLCVVDNLFNFNWLYFSLFLHFLYTKRIQLNIEIWCFELLWNAIQYLKSVTELCVSMHLFDMCDVCVCLNQSIDSNLICMFKVLVKRNHIAAYEIMKLTGTLQCECVWPHYNIYLTCVNLRADEIVCVVVVVFTVFILFFSTVVHFVYRHKHKKKQQSHDDCYFCSDNRSFLFHTIAVCVCKRAIDKCLEVHSIQLIWAIIVKWQTIDLHISFILCHQNHSAYCERVFVFLYLSLCVHFSLNKYALISICTFDATLECNYGLICKVNLSLDRLNKMNTNNFISNQNMHSSLLIMCTMRSNVKIHNRMIRPNDLKWK